MATGLATSRNASTWGRNATSRIPAFTPRAAFGRTVGASSAASQLSMASIGSSASSSSACSSLAAAARQQQRHGTQRHHQQQLSPAPVTSRPSQPQAQTPPPPSINKGLAAAAAAAADLLAAHKARAAAPAPAGRPSNDATLGSSGPGHDQLQKRISELEVELGKAAATRHQLEVSE